jgi:DNA-directed RNA polymerase
MTGPNHITSLDAAMAFLTHVGCQGRGASEFARWLRHEVAFNTVWLE